MFPFKDASHIHAQRLRAEQYQCKKEEKLKPTVRRHDDYFLFKTFQGAAARTPDKPVTARLPDQAKVSRSSLFLLRPQPFTPHRVSNRNRKKQHACPNTPQIPHNFVSC